MNIRKTLTVTPIAAALCAASLFASHSANAYVYAGSQLDITELSVTISNPSGFASATGFGFATSTSAELNGATDGDADSCGSAGTACGTSPALSSDAANAPGSDIIRADGNYTLFGDKTKTYANANAAILTSELGSNLVDKTSASLVSEANLVGNGNASASTSTQSNTNLSFLFTAVGSATITVEFDASLINIAEINNGIDRKTLDANAQYSSVINASITNLSGGGEWESNGVSADCIGICSGSDTDPFDLNATQSTSAGISVFTGLEFGDPSAISHSSPGVGTYSFTFTVDCGGVGVECDGTLNLFASNAVTIRNAIPEPSSLGLLGLGLIAMARLGRRKKAVM
ncbi:MAG: EDSAP-1 family PEP-CTERM protein [Porticoccaceae bacterium]|jgi:hypothetical protein|nr:EDSAP-1 family PEP-CTERM protein [Porticoccaceae bacterium]